MSGLVSLVVKGCVLGMLIRFELLKYRESGESGEYAVDSSEGTIRRDYSISGAFRFFASL
jgi:hypothetical protein